MINDVSDIHMHQGCMHTLEMLLYIAQELLCSKRCLQCMTLPMSQPNEDGLVFRFYAGCESVLRNTKTGKKAKQKLEHGASLLCCDPTWQSEQYIALI